MHTMEQDSWDALKRLMEGLEEIKRKHKSLEKDIAKVRRSLAAQKAQENR